MSEINIRLMPLIKRKKEETKTSVSTRGGSLRNIYDTKVNRIIKKRK